MEKITISRIGIEKTIEYTNKKTGKPDSFKKVGVQTNEYGERWFDITYRGEVPVKVGQSVDVEISEREYVGKDGVTRKAYDAKLPQEKRGGGSGMNEDDKARMIRIERAVNAILNEFKIMRGGKSSLEGVVNVPESTPTAFDDADPFESSDPFAGMETKPLT